MYTFITTLLMLTLSTLGEELVYSGSTSVACISSIDDEDIFISERNGILSVIGKKTVNKVGYSFLSKVDGENGFYNYGIRNKSIKKNSIDFVDKNLNSREIFTFSKESTITGVISKNNSMAFSTLSAVYRINGKGLTPTRLLKLNMSDKSSSLYHIAPLPGKNDLLVVGKDENSNFFSIIDLMKGEVKTTPIKLNTKNCAVVNYNGKIFFFTSKGSYELKFNEDNYNIESPKSLSISKNYKKQYSLCFKRNLIFLIPVSADSPSICVFDRYRELISEIKFKNSNNDQITALHTLKNKIYVGWKSGRVTSYDIQKLVKENKVKSTR